MTSIRADGAVEFRFFRPGAASVGVAGEFNEWCGEALQMCQTADGWWTAAARLPSGEYRFRYIADGRWFTDFASHGVEAVEKVGWNSVLVVPEVIKQIRERHAA
jgi:1,4-alpha-glucan branching enzyme